MHAAFAIKNNMEFFASMSTGLVELVVLIVKPVYGVANSLPVLPHRLKNLVITTGAVRKVLLVDVMAFARYTIENAGFGNVVSSSLQLVVDIGNSNLWVSIIADPLAV